MTAIAEMQKQPAEAYTMSVSVAARLVMGVTLASGVVSAFDAAGTNVSGTVLASTTATIATPVASVKIQGGIHGQDYRVRFVLTLSNGEILEEDRLLHVENL